jgi:hypothetical protein
MESLWPNTFSALEATRFTKSCAATSSCHECHQCHQYHLFHVTMRFSPRSFFWTAQLSGLQDTATVAGADSQFTQHLGFHGFHMFHRRSLDLSPLNRNLFCSSKWLENI